MASGWTNRGKFRMLQGWFRNTSVPTNFYVQLVTNAATPTVDTKTMSELTEIAAGNGYTAGGQALARNATDFDVLTEDDVNDRALIQTKNIVWTASGGPIPSSGTGAYHMVLNDDNVTVGSRDVQGFFDLVGPISVSAGQSLTIIDPEFRLT